MDNKSKKRSHQDLGSNDGPKAKKFKAAQPEANGKSVNGSGSAPNEVITFPRGEKKRSKGDRESVVLPTKKKQDRDLLFDSKRLEEQLEEKENSKKKRRRSKGKKEKKADDELFDDMQLDEDEEAELEVLVTEATKAPKRIELLKPSSLVEGVLLYGCIREINDLYLNISLPNNLKGSVSITEVSDSLNILLEREANEEDMNEDSVPSLFSLFKVGQFVKCAVHKVHQRKIDLTLRESVLNASLALDAITPGMPVYGSVKSVEDHGYVVSLGIEGINAFIPKKFLSKKKKEGEEEEPEETKLIVGQLIDGLVSEVKKESKTVFINPNQDRVATKVTKEVSGLTLETLKPGMLVQAYIQAILADGLWVKFLGYFAGGISIYHLNKTYTSEELAGAFKNGQKLPARIMHVDPQNKTVSLSMKKSIIQMQPFAFDEIAVGDIFDEAVIRRIDAPIGVLLEVKPTEDGEPILGYAHASKLTDGNFEKVFKTMTVGEKVQCRVLSFNYIDELVNVSLRKSDIEQKFLRYEDIKPGQQLTATVSKITDKGILLKITEFIRAYLPKFHAADITIENFQARFSVGGKIACRALMVDPSKKRLIVTHKRALIGSDLPVLASYDDAKEDMVIHGTIVAVGPFGCRLRFYGDVTALAPISELSAGYVHDPVKMFQPGLVKKCRIVSVTPKQRRLIVSFLMDKENEQTEEWTRVFDSIKTGQLIDGVVTQASERGIDVKIGGQVEAFIPAYHLSDHRAHFALLAKRFKVGEKVSDMLVLRVRPQKKYLGLTLKPSLKAAAKANKIPKSFEEVKKDETYFGVIKKITSFGVIVRFMNQIQGLSLRMNLADVFISNPEEFFYVGQTVRAHITEVIPETQQFSFTLRQSFAASQDSEFIDSYFSEEAGLEKPKAGIDWNKYKVGTIVKGTVTDVADYGVILTLDDKVKGFAHVKQVVGKVQTGNEVECVVLDIDKFKNIVDVSLRTELINQVRGNDSGKAVEPLKKDKQVDAVVELIKANYLILSLSGKHGAGNKSLIAYASTRDYNTEVFADPFNAYRPLQKVTAVVKKAPSNDRIILGVTSGFRQKKGLSELAANAINTIDDVEIGSLVKVQVKRIYDNQMTVTVGMHVQGRVHITEVTDDITESNPFSKFSVGQVIDEARVVSFSARKSNKYLPITHQDAGEMKVVEVSLRPSVVKQWNDKPHLLPSLDALQKGQIVNGWVHKLTPDGIWVYLSSTVRGRVFILDASNDINVLRNMADHFKPCQGVRCKVLSIDVDRQALDLSIKALANESNKAATPDKVKPGMIVPARILRVKLNESVTVQLFAHTYGRAYITDLFDNYVKDPIAEFVSKEGEIVNCCVLGVNKDDNQIDVSLRPSRVNPALRPEVKYPEITSMKDVTPGIIVQGYVKHTANNTLYVALSRNVTGRVFFKNLSNKFIKNPSKMYPIGKLVTGRVISITDEFIDLSLKKSDVQQKRIVFEDLKVDQIVKGFVKRLDPKFGVFVTIKDCGLVGLCHLSEVDDEYVKPEDLKNRFKIKDAVKARIIRLNTDKKQISLTLKPSKLEGVEDSESSSESDEESDEEVEEVEETKKSKKDDKKDKKAKVLMPVDGDDSDDDAILNEARDQDEDDSDDMEQDNEDDEDDEDEAQEQQEEEESSEEVKPKKNKKETKKDLSQRILTPSGYAFDEGHVSDSDDENYVSKLAEQMSGDDDEEMDEVDDDNEDNRGDNEDEDNEAEEEEAMEVEQDEESEKEVKKSSKKQSKAEGISVGFDWNGTGDNEDADEDSDDEETTSKKKPVVAKPQSEDTDGDGLNTAEDYEKALFANPNSSYLWIRFIAYWLGVTEVDKAREVAERALKRIEARLGDEKLNVWIAYMNLENTYGTPQSLTEVFQRACTYNDPKRVHFELIKIHTNSGNTELASELHKTLVKKYKDSKRVWMKYGLFKFKQGQPEAARNILDRSLKSLAKRKHLEVISKFAQYEYKHGAVERGRTIFENILSTYPKRLDLWSVYIDMEVVAEAYDKARSIFERVATLNLSSKKMRFIFKKWLQFEKDHGTVKQQEHVKQRATEYVESRSQK